MNGVVSKPPQGSVQIAGHELIIRMRYHQGRFTLLKRLPQAVYDAKQRSWRVPLLHLPKLLKSKHFQAPAIEYQFDLAAAQEQVRCGQEQQAAARERLQQQPFFVSPTDIILAQPEIVFQSAEAGAGVRVKLRFGSSLKRDLLAVRGVHYLKPERAFFFPVESLNDFLRGLRERGKLFAVAKELGQRLAQSAQWRAELLTGSAAADAAQLAHCALLPLVDLAAASPESRRFAFKGWTAEQLRLCLPQAGSFSQRKAQAAALDTAALLALLINAQTQQVRVWRTAAVQAALRQEAERVERSFACQQGVFPEAVLALYTPSAAWTLQQGRGALLIERARWAALAAAELPVGAVAVDYQESPDHMVCWWRDSYLLPAYRYSESRLGTLPQTEGFQRLLAELLRREKLRQQRDELQQAGAATLTLADTDVAAKLFEHQKTAVNWLLQQPHCFLGDDMGLGKTLSVLAAFAELKQREVVDFLLVICPNSLVRNWQRECEQWTPQLRWAVVPTAKAERTRLLADLSERPELWDALAINYEALRSAGVLPALKCLSQRRRLCLCLDESQRVKNPRSKTFAALSEVAPRCCRRVLLSGTPTPRDVADIWAQMQILDQGERLGHNFYDWLAQVAELGTQWSRFAVKRFIPEEVYETVCRVQEVLLRRRKEDVLDLPDKVFSFRDIELSGSQKQRYDEVTKELLLRLSTKSGAEFVREIDSILEEYLRAVQVASNPRLIDESWQGDPAKFVELDEIVREVVVENQGKIVIWTNYLLNVAEVVERYRHWGAAGFTGELSRAVRAELIDDFQSSRSGSLPILVAVPAAGGLGITLTAAQTAVYLDRTWNAEHWLQSVDRLHRIGQRGTVNIIVLNACRVDELIGFNLRRKERFQERLLSGAGTQPAPLGPTREELLAALG